jgi:hypothetical protein
MANDYDKQTWANTPAGETPLSAARLTHIEDGIGDHVHDEPDEPGGGPGVPDSAGRMLVSIRREAENAAWALQPNPFPGTFTGGTFTITLFGDTTTPLAWDADPGTTEVALGALPSVGDGNIRVPGGFQGPDVTIELDGALTGTVVTPGDLTVDASGLTGPDAPYLVSVIIHSSGAPEGVAVEWAPGWGTTQGDLLQYNEENQDWDALGATLGATLVGGRVDADNYRWTSTNCSFAPQILASQVDPSRNEVQYSEVSPGGLTGGTWTLTHGGQTTSALAHNADAATVVAALEALSTVGIGDIRVTDGPDLGGGFTFEFTGSKAGAGQDLLGIDGAGLTGPDAPYVVAMFRDEHGHPSSFTAGWFPEDSGSQKGHVLTVVPGPPNQRQLLVLNQAVPPTGGTWTVSLDGETTTLLAWNADENDIATAIADFRDLSIDFVWVWKENDFRIHVDFGDNEDRPLVTVDGSLLTGPDAPYTYDVTEEQAVDPDSLQISWRRPNTVDGGVKLDWGPFLVTGPWIKSGSVFYGTATLTVGPSATAAMGTVAPPPDIAALNAPGEGVAINVTMTVANATATESIVVGGTVGLTETATGAWTGYSLTGSDVDVLSQVGTDLEWDTGTGAVTTTAGGVFFVSIHLKVTNE